MSQKSTRLWDLPNPKSKSTQRLYEQIDYFLDACYEKTESSMDYVPVAEMWHSYQAWVCNTPNEPLTRGQFERALGSRKPHIVRWDGKYSISHLVRKNQSPAALNYRGDRYVQIDMFLEHSCERTVSDDDVMPMNDLWELYHEWVYSTDEMPFTKGQFNRAIRSRKLRVVKLSARKFVVTRIKKKFNIDPYFDEFLTQEYVYRYGHHKVLPELMYLCREYEMWAKDSSLDIAVTVGHVAYQLGIRGITTRFMWLHITNIIDRYINLDFSGAGLEAKVLEMYKHGGLTDEEIISFVRGYVADKK